ncbi:hypothetical protein WJ94_15205 [Burkholderia ubonensis]|uniref:DUF2514 family protein n=1 Tax=Burkholderia ubonensis TaxID=101571 RepID=UPI00075B3EAA|nr:DUF2514 family protein [Burkholderia ubonensis]KVP78227.1 hypothetical protein WJ94_15205 [Burkholderia ubonensis]
MSWIDPRIWLVVIAGIVAGSAGGYFKGYRDADESAKVAAQAKQIDELATERDEYRRQSAAQQEIATHAAKERDQARGDAAAAASAADGLRRQVAALVAGIRRSATSAGGSSASDALDLLADVLGRADARAGELATIADERGIAGQQCEHSYDALTSDVQIDQPR